MKSTRYVIAFLTLLVLLCCFLLVNLCAGSVQIPLEEALLILRGAGGDEVARDIILDIRFPRALAAAILGGALALSGYLLQTFFHNPIASPFTLGISSGAKLVVALVMIAALNCSIQISSLGMIAAAFGGALLCMGFVLLLSRAVSQMSMLIISGVMIGYICSAVTDFVVTFADDANIVNLHNWSKGSFSGVSWGNTVVMAVVVLPTLLGTFLLSKPISAYQMGETYAQNMGIHIGRFRMVLVLLSSILSACVTAFAGPVSFVGIAVPHLVKSLFGTAKPVIMVPACFLGGAVFCLFCDLLARVLFAPTELGISTVTAMFGAPGGHLHHGAAEKGAGAISGTGTVFYGQGADHRLPRRSPDPGHHLFPPPWGNPLPHWPQRRRENDAAQEHHPSAGPIGWRGHSGRTRHGYPQRKRAVYPHGGGAYRTGQD